MSSRGRRARLLANHTRTPAAMSPPSATIVHPERNVNSRTFVDVVGAPGGVVRRTMSKRRDSPGRADGAAFSATIAARSGVGPVERMETRKRTTALARPARLTDELVSLIQEPTPVRVDPRKPTEIVPSFAARASAA